MSKARIYISGPISGTTDYMARFEKAEKELSKNGEDISISDVSFRTFVTYTNGIRINGIIIYINGGRLDITANSPFDYDGTAQNNGGTIIINGTQTNTITNQMMGGGMKGGQQGGTPGQMEQNGGMQMNGGRRGR